MTEETNSGSGETCSPSLIMTLESRQTRLNVTPRNTEQIEQAMSSVALDRIESHQDQDMCPMKHERDDGFAVMSLF